MPIKSSNSIETNILGAYLYTINYLLILTWLDEPQPTGGFGLGEAHPPPSIGARV